jgi:hypothetical protein
MKHHCYPSLSTRLCLSSVKCDVAQSVLLLLAVMSATMELGRTDHRCELNVMWCCRAKASFKQLHPLIRYLFHCTDRGLGKKETTFRRC